MTTLSVVLVVLEKHVAQRGTGFKLTEIHFMLDVN